MVYIRKLQWAVFDTLLPSTTTLLGAATAPDFFEIDTPTAHQCYKFSMLSSEGLVFNICSSIHVML